MTLSAAALYNASLSPPALIALCVFPLASLVAFVIYQLYFHPLAQYPGPLLGRITRLYDLYHAYKGDKHLVLYHLHQRYGTVVRYCPNTVSINDPAALKAIYSHGANVTKNEFYKVIQIHLLRLLKASCNDKLIPTSASAPHRTPSPRCSPLRRRTTRGSAASPDKPSRRRPCAALRSTFWRTRRR